LINPLAAPAPERYRSCRHIERSLVFYPGRVNACCANPVTGATPTLSPFTGGDLSAEAVRAGRAKIKADHKAGGVFPECAQCPRLTEHNWETDPAMGEYAIDEVTIAHFTTCNIRCNYCYTVRNERDATALLSKVPRLLRTFEQLIAEKQLAPYATVRFSGGEPTLLPEFEDLLTLLSEYGVRSVVYTNAVNRSEAIHKALRLDRVELVLGIDAATAEVYRAVKKMDYNEQVWENVAANCASTVPNSVNKVWAKFIYLLDNYTESELFVERAAAAGVKNIYYDLDSSRIIVGRGCRLTPLPEEIADRIARMQYDCDRFGIVMDFAQSGLAWMTPERTARIERELQRLKSDRQEVALAG
jgi:pyruvate-formate lyase-activating enzyme